MPRAVDLGVKVGQLPPGPTDSVLDVPGVGLGHATVWRDEAEPPRGRGVARTGVTVLLVAEDAFEQPVPAGAAVLNGAGEFTGLITAGEWGLLETPVLLTSTMQVGRVYDAACQLMVQQVDLIGEDVVIPVVGECDDSYLNEARRMQVEYADVAAAWHAAYASRGGKAVEQGSVGAGTGMSCLGFKGGIGTSSRVTPEGYTVGVLLLTNFGTRDRLTVDGVAVGRLLPEDERPSARSAGSCIGVVVSDAPLDGAACARLARRVGLGLARTGSTAHHGSGEIFLGAATGARTSRGSQKSPATLAGDALDPLFAGVVEASEQAVLNSMLMSPTVVGRAGNVSQGLAPDQVVRLLRRYGRLS